MATKIKEVLGGRKEMTNLKAGMGLWAAGYVALLGVLFWMWDCNLQWAVDQGNGDHLGEGLYFLFSIFLLTAFCLVMGVVLAIVWFKHKKPMIGIFCAGFALGAVMISVKSEKIYDASVMGFLKLVDAQTLQTSQECHIRYYRDRLPKLLQRYKRRDRGQDKTLLS